MHHAKRTTWLLLGLTCVGVVGCTMDAWLWPFGNYYDFKNGVSGTTTDLSGLTSTLLGSTTATTGDTTTTGIIDGSGTTGTTAQIPTITEDFSETSLEGWSVIGGSWIVGGGQVRATGPSGDGYGIMVVGETDWADYQVSVDIRLESGTEYCLGVRFQNAETWYHCSHTVGGIASITKFKTSAPAIELAAASSTPLAPGEWYTFKVIVQGSTITMFVEGERAASATDTTDPLTSGMIALLVPAGSSISFDNVEIEPLGS